MKIDNRAITRNALQSIRNAHAEIYNDSASPFAARIAAMHLLFNVTDHVLGLLTNEYVSRTLKAEHAQYSRDWCKQLDIRTCDDCGEYMHDIHAVPCESPAGHMFVLCETCAVLNGFADVCTQCTLVYSYDDMVRHVPAYLAEHVLTSTNGTALVSYVCVDCFPTLSYRRTATGPA